ncbi:ATP-binding protein [Candidatus Palauibacter sp.]|uniref:DNA polymerase III subunit n=1 Tax=Candidatus Palauibacter sp. TaxID=3101350 RepID=UPI003B020EE6
MAAGEAVNPGRPETAADVAEPWGQDDLRRRVGAAIAAGRLPQSLLLHGPEGVGKRPLALWIARALQCGAQQSGEPPRNGEGGPCGTCRSCRMAARLEHPDIHLHFPMPRPKGTTSRAKLREAIEAQRHERLALLRDDLHARLDPDAVTGLYVAAVENIRGQASRRPSMARKAVFVVEDADRMVPQSASPEAANAFLKLLEEPPDFAWIVLTSSRPEALLPTIRSRSVPLRVAPVATDSVAAYLTDQLGAPPDRALAVARRADGAVYRARRLMRTTESEDSDTSETAADQLLAAALDGSPAARYRTASRYSARGARGNLGPALEDLRVRLRDLLCVAVDAASQAHDADRVQRLTRGGAVTDRAVLHALGSVERALEGVGRNMNPQATIALLLQEMGAAFAGRRPGTHH